MPLLATEPTPPGVFAGSATTLWSRVSDGAPRRVAAAVVHKNNLQVRVRLLQHARDGVADRVFGVEARDDHADLVGRRVLVIFHKRCGCRARSRGGQRLLRGCCRYGS